MKDFNHIQFLEKISLEKGYRNFSFKSYKTGSSYISLNRGELTIRISDHEPNFAMTKFRGEADHEIYTHDAGNKKINDDIDVIDRVLDITGIELPEEIAKELEAAREERSAHRARVEIAAEQNRKDMEEVQERVSEFHAQIREAIAGREDEINAILTAAESYGEESPKKRRKREVSFFKREFKNIFGFEATPGDIQRAKRIV